MAKSKPTKKATPKKAAQQRKKTPKPTPVDPPEPEEAATLDTEPSPEAEVSPLVAVAHDETLEGDGTESAPLSVAPQPALVKCRYCGREIEKPTDTSFYICDTCPGTGEPPPAGA